MEAALRRLLSTLDRPSSVSSGHAAQAASTSGSTGTDTGTATTATTTSLSVGSSGSNGGGGGSFGAAAPYTGTGVVPYPGDPFGQEFNLRPDPSVVAAWARWLDGYQANLRAHGYHHRFTYVLLGFYCTLDSTRLGAPPLHTPLTR
jgi:hypothetical protein